MASEARYCHHCDNWHEGPHIALDQHGPPAPLGVPGGPGLEELQALSRAADEADGPAAYHMALMALAMATRSYLRALSASGAADASLRELANKWRNATQVKRHEAIRGVGCEITDVTEDGFEPLRPMERAILRQCADELEAVLDASRREQE